MMTIRARRVAAIFGGGLAILCLPGPASAEVFCTTASYHIAAYVYGMPALENIILTNGSSMANVSLCGTNCTDSATDHRLSLAITAKARGVPLLLYFGDKNSCSDVTALEKPFMVRLAD